MSGSGGRGTEVGERRSGSGCRGTEVGERRSGNGCRGTEVGERRSGNGGRGTEVGERRSGNGGRGRDFSLELPRASARGARPPYRALLPFFLGFGSLSQPDECEASSSYLSLGEGGGVRAGSRQGISDQTSLCNLCQPRVRNRPSRARVAATDVCCTFATATGEPYFVR